MKDYNLYIFEKINSWQGKNRWLDAFGRAGAQWAVVASALWYLVSALIVCRPEYVNALAPILTCFVAWIFLWLLGIGIGLVVHEPRPEMTLSGIHKLFTPLMRWKSFPSDHAMTAFLFFFCALIFGLPGAWALLVLALWVSFGRIFSGAHYPIDIIGGLATAALAAIWMQVIMLFI